jgi:hypothetical protein
METLTHAVATSASNRRTAWIVAGAIAAVWVPFLVPLAHGWLASEEYAASWLRELYWKPGALLAALVVLPFEPVDPERFHLLASLLALAECGALAVVAARSKSAGIWILCAGAVLSFAQAFLLAFMATHG